jgi:hypothetical protein
VSSPAAVLVRRAVLRRRIRLLVAATITYNLVEAIIAISAGTVAGSIALIGFGLDSDIRAVVTCQNVLVTVVLTLLHTDLFNAGRRSGLQS